MPQTKHCNICQKVLVLPKKPQNVACPTCGMVYFPIEFKELQ